MLSSNVCVTASFVCALAGAARAASKAMIGAGGTATRSLSCGVKLREQSVSARADTAMAAPSATLAKRMVMDDLPVQCIQGSAGSRVFCGVCVALRRTLGRDIGGVRPDGRRAHAHRARPNLRAAGNLQS